MSQKHTASAVKRATSLALEGQVRWSQFAQYAPFIVPGWDTNDMNLSYSMNTPIRKNQHVYDTTAIDSTNTLANGLLSYVTPPEEHWAQLDAENIPPFLKVPFNKLNSAATQRLSSVFASSNLYDSLLGLYTDLGSFCTACLYVGYQNDEIIFDRVPAGTYGFDESFNGTLLEFSRKLVMTVGQIEDFFKELPKELMGKEVSATATVYHYVRKDIKTNKIMGSWVIEECKGKAFKEEEYKTFPYIVAKFQTGNSKWGVGPGFFARSDVMQLNGMQKSLDLLLKKIADPPTFKTASIRNALSLAPGAMNTIQRASDMPAQLPPQGNPQAAAARIETLTTNIRKYFYTDLFTMFQTLAAQNSSRRTTAEVAQLEQERRNSFAAVLYSLTHSLLKPLTARAFTLDYTYNVTGEIKTILDENEELRQFVIDEKTGTLKSENVKVSSFLRKALEQRKLQVGLGKLEMFSQLGPDVAMMVDPKLVAGLYDDAYNVSVDVMRSEEEIKAMQEAQAQQQQLAAAAEVSKIQAYQKQSEAASK